MARRRSRALAGSDSHHASEVKRYAAPALKQYAAASEAAAQGSCVKAFRDFTKAVENDGKAGAHFMEAPHAGNRALEELADKVGSAHSHAFRSFDLYCLSGAPRPMSGLAGRRRRSLRRK